ncbi:MAG: glutamine amidotransferase-related protein, partial [Desulfitobacteriaceae bacterium]
MIDNYDSFTYNLVQELGRLGAEIKVVRNDEQTVAAILAEKPQGIIISPGPCTPNEAGVSLELLTEIARRAEQGEIIPVLGVCLGHQALAKAMGGRVVRAPQVVHGKKSKIYHNGRGLFAGLEQGFTAGRYHSLIVDRESLSADWEVSAYTENGLVMGLQHRRFPFYGVQFHPESILTREGEKILQQFLELCVSQKQELSQAEKGERSMSGIREALDKLSVGGDLTEELAAQVMIELLAGDIAPSQVGALLLGLRVKGETAEEIAGFARVLRGLSNTIPAPTATVDTCGTGGDSAGTFNISTTAAFVVAGAGVPVAKHGNRFASGRCGSADVLEQLGVALDLKPEESA